jgi:hypothetical protein
MDPNNPNEHKDYAFKNEISLSIGEDGVDSANSTPSTVTPPAIPTPSPRQNFQIESDKKPLTNEESSGIDNPGFDETETPSNNRQLTSFGNGHSNGLNEPTALGVNDTNKNMELNDKKLAEAVNLELININSNNNLKKPTTTNGNHNELPIKKDSDVETGEPYGDYFISVNEHRKYMRGEKLVVTKDTRSKSKKNRLVWILCLGIVAAAIILGILAMGKCHLLANNIA